jgi:23S rRNA (cytidine2498-2'-O)-methyltransferase
VSRTIEQLFASKLGRSQKKNGANGKALKNENLTLESQENPGEGPLGVEFSNEVKKNLEHRRLLKSKNALFIFFDSFQSVYMGHEKLNTQGPWPTGIPRFKSYAKAPSRSTLKLEEALAVFKAKSGNGNLVTSGMTAVDLGAAPGGWTFLLVRLGCFVTAIDNGALDQTLLASGMVDHFCEDAFKFKPDKPVDWLVCDMIEQPQKVAKLVGKWFELGWCNKAIVNLKLPMKQKLDAIDESLQVLQENAESNINEQDLVLDIFWKHLYHDRDEVTLMITSNKISK